MKVAIVITNYNQGHLIERAIKSTLNQKYYINNQEHSPDIIIVDDGSTDDSINIISKIINDPIKLISKENGGTASARNTGVRSCNHDFISFLDADDEYLENKIAKSFEEINRYSRIGCVYSDYIETKLDGTKTRSFKPSFDFGMLLKNCIVSTNSMISREAYEAVGGFDESIRGCEDYDLWLRISAAGFMIRNIPEALFIYHNHGQNKTLTSDMKQWMQEEQKIKDRVLKGFIHV